MDDDDLDEASLDKMEAVRDDLRRHLDGFATGRIQVLKREPGTTDEDLAEMVRDHVASITTTLNRHGRG